ncbi:TetR/AcrR family transcriptional regulator [Blastococcus sp. PRF04-17]|uniref:TetR/AcrR family transcriptional regulator n=1 Tax=Blastococcus sp. PRF04-17 TaxID=2933797 RepID=UPI001FF2081B|nr:TetR/AcrR family transcriptional regulator [Blastococcus sp. PRF04-17]UOY02199.1 TetR/AcrR family transcriptional regulator [Blastococcus sp. PRF04-17]
MHGPPLPLEDPAVDDGYRRGRILRALATCLEEKGYAATTSADIARVAQVSKSALYAHFHDKEECLLELVSRATDKVLETIRRSQEEAVEADVPWRERLRLAVATLLDALGSGPEVAWAVVVEVQAAGRRGRALRRNLLDRYTALIRETAADLARRFPDEVREVDEKQVVAAVGGIHELMLLRVERGDAARLAEETDAAAQVLVGLLERRRP